MSGNAKIQVQLRVWVEGLTSFNYPSKVFTLPDDEEDCKNNAIIVMFNSKKFMALVHLLTDGDLPRTRAALGNDIVKEDTMKNFLLIMEKINYFSKPNTELLDGMLVSTVEVKKPPPPRVELPSNVFGLRNFGNTCWFNAFIQVLFLHSNDEIRDAIQKKLNEESKKLGAGGLGGLLKAVSLQKDAQKRTKLYEIFVRRVQERLLGLKGSKRREQWDPDEFVRKIMGLSGMPIFWGEWRTGTRRELKDECIMNENCDAVPSSWNEIESNQQLDLSVVSSEYDSLQLEGKEPTLANYLDRLCNPPPPDDMEIVNCGGLLKHRCRSFRKKVYFIKLPKYAVVNINRQDYFEDSKFGRVRVIRLKNPVTDFESMTLSSDEGEGTYRLMGAVRHIGGGDGGHYVASARVVLKDGKEVWYQFDDDDDPKQMGSPDKYKAYQRNATMLLFERVGMDASKAPKEKAASKKTLKRGDNEEFQALLNEALNRASGGGERQREDAALAVKRRREAAEKRKAEEEKTRREAAEEEKRKAEEEKRRREAALAAAEKRKAEEENRRREAAEEEKRRREAAEEEKRRREATPKFKVGFYVYHTYSSGYSSFSAPEICLAKVSGFTNTKQSLYGDARIVRGIPDHERRELSKGKRGYRKLKYNWNNLSKPHTYRIKFGTNYKGVDYYSVTVQKGFIRERFESKDYFADLTGRNENGEKVVFEVENADGTPLASRRIDGGSEDKEAKGNKKTALAAAEKKRKSDEEKEKAERKRKASPSRQTQQTQTQGVSADQNSKTLRDLAERLQRLEEERKRERKEEADALRKRKEELETYRTNAERLQKELRETIEQMKTDREEKERKEREDRSRLESRLSEAQRELETLKTQLVEGKAERDKLEEARQKSLADGQYKKAQDNLALLARAAEERRKREEEQEKTRSDVAEILLQISQLEPVKRPPTPQKDITPDPEPPSTDPHWFEWEWLKEAAQTDDLTLNPSSKPKKPNKPEKPKKRKRRTPEEIETDRKKKAALQAARQKQRLAKKKKEADKKEARKKQRLAQQAANRKKKAADLAALQEAKRIKRLADQAAKKKKKAEDLAAAKAANQKRKEEERKKRVEDRKDKKKRKQDEKDRKSRTVKSVFLLAGKPVTKEWLLFGDKEELIKDYLKEEEKKEGASFQTLVKRRAAKAKFRLELLEKEEDEDKLRLLYGSIGTNNPSNLHRLTCYPYRVVSDEDKRRVWFVDHLNRVHVSDAEIESKVLKGGKLTKVPYKEQSLWFRFLNEVFTWTDLDTIQDTKQGPGDDAKWVFSMTGAAKQKREKERSEGIKSEKTWVYRAPGGLSEEGMDIEDWRRKAIECRRGRREPTPDRILYPGILWEDEYVNPQWDKDKRLKASYFSNNFHLVNREDIKEHMSVFLGFCFFDLFRKEAEPVLHEIENTMWDGGAVRKISEWLNAWWKREIAYAYAMLDPKFIHTELTTLWNSISNNDALRTLGLDEGDIPSMREVFCYCVLDRVKERLFESTDSMYSREGDVGKEDKLKNILKIPVPVSPISELEEALPPPSFGITSRIIIMHRECLNVTRLQGRREGTPKLLSVTEELKKQFKRAVVQQQKEERRRIGESKRTDKKDEADSSSDYDSDLD